jgi:leader peptidase (prepilin peptidase)/N-methyltransferase
VTFDLAALLLVAPFIGSFLGVVITRLPQGRPVVLSRSVCDHCATPLGVRDLVPLVSHVTHRGRCRHCGGAIAPEHVAVELAAIAIVLAAAAVEPDPAALWLDCALGWSLLTLAWIDWQCMRLPDSLTLPLLLAGLGVTAVQQPDALTDHATAAAVAYLALRGLAVAYRRLRGRDGLGAGDAKLLAAAGAWLGLAPLPWVLLFAASGGLLAALVFACMGRRIEAGTALPFGPWLALALWLLWLCHAAYGGSTS